jgi:hypothetical protein
MREGGSVPTFVALSRSRRVCRSNRACPAAPNRDSAQTHVIAQSLGTYSLAGILAGTDPSFLRATRVML